MIYKHPHYPDVLRGCNSGCGGSVGRRGVDVGVCGGSGLGMCYRASWRRCRVSWCLGSTMVCGLGCLASPATSRQTLRPTSQKSRLTYFTTRPTGDEDMRPCLLARGIASFAALGWRHGQRLAQLLNGSVQRLCMGFAGLVLHEGMMSWLF